MVNIIANKDSGYVLIDGQPWQVGSLRIHYSDDDRLLIYDRESQRVPIVSAHYSDVSDDGSPFVSFVEMKTFIETNFFF